MDIAAIGRNIPYILIGLLGFGFLVVWHELGHFLLAKLNGVEVREFSVGMGKKIFGIKGKETEYNLRMLPIGGYVSMLGEEGGSDDSRSVTNKSNIRRLSIVAAGPIFNFILAIFLFATVYSVYGTQIPRIEKIAVDSGAAASELKVGDDLLAIDGYKVNTWTDFRYRMSENTGQKVNILINRDGTEKVIEVQPQKEIVEGKETYLAGIYPVVYKPQFGEALNIGVKEVKSSIGMTLGFFGKLFEGKASKDDVGGPVKILEISGSFAKQGFIPMLFFLAMISTQLAIFNIIPIPALDGGWIVMLTLQMITGKKFSDEIVGKINYAGMIFLLTLMALVTLKDLFL